MDLSYALTQRDLRAIYLLLGECSELGRLPEVWTARLYAGLSRLLGLRLGLFLEGTRGMAHGQTPPGAKDRVLIHGLPAQEVIGRMRAYAGSVRLRDDPAVPAWQRVRGAVTARGRAELVPRSVWSESAIVRDYFRPLGIDEMLFARCPAGSGRWLLLNLWRAPGDAPFGDRELALARIVVEEAGPLLRSGRLAALHHGSGALAPRQRQVLALLCRGLTERQVAETLAISPHTAHNHIQRLHAALGAHTHGELLAAAYRHGLAGEEIPHAATLNPMPENGAEEPPAAG
jgi:DNA-binding CsgD family transcriptional regulator